ncbi:exodeoxyribonuclease VII small subunit [Niallia taxi]|uniref:Exodeoxyribonuclease 7 small subunit n=1 Tax=Niallia taxi TaxID=2499688 RepID=A0A437KDW4_9BACI|nr:exodeoxyribonuclease VII small subunit [Niallia taxi]MCM3215429.1 exodeoxyribonuclease VII small subunit [Niallia taxi]MCT2346266.1 exodeoxyribonuclease VII small subunit [Niallia taxi]MDE5052113.1 exodeoxyribonuclease VII small subunit [Niallia taxi]MDK8639731.1 exodeoxyribonuclease VII small subunit [Niallia taxi]MED3961967.1 exodeoxyribonuclease VII small subunit [Niallia taxi]
MAKNGLSFEEAMEELEKIVEKLEEGDVPLEEAINTYKRGMELSKFCHDKLKNVEEQLAEIVLDNGQKEAFSINEEE